MSHTASPYNYHLDLNSRSSPPFTLDQDQISLPITLPTTGAGHKFVLTPTYKVPGGLLANRDFRTEYEGALHFTINQTSTVYFTIAFAHVLLEADLTTVLYKFRSDRTDQILGVGNSQGDLHFNVFNSITQLPIGTFRTRDGTEITVTQEVLNRQLKLEIDLFIRAGRAGTQLTALNIDNTAAVHFRQLKDVAPPLSTDGVYPNIDDFKIYFGIDTDEFDGPMTVFLAHATDWAEQYTRRNYSGIAREETDEEHYFTQVTYKLGSYYFQTYWDRPVSVSKLTIIDSRGNETQATNVKALTYLNRIQFNANLPSSNYTIKVDYEHFAGSSGVVNQVILVYASGLAIQSRIPELQKSTVINERIGDYDVAYSSQLFQLNRTSGTLNMLEKILDGYRSKRL